MFRGLSAIIYKEVYHVIRDPKTLILLFIIPAMDMTMFGYAIDLEVRNIPTVVYNLDQRKESAEFIRIIQNSGIFNIIHFVYSEEELHNNVIRGNAKVALKFPPDFTDCVLMGKPTSVQVLIDGSDATIAMQASQVMDALALKHSVHLVTADSGETQEIPVDIRSRVLFNPGMKTPNFMVPALVAIVIQLVITTLTALSVVKEREHGTLEQLMVTPVSRPALVLGKLLPYSVIGSLETALVICIMVFVFNVPISGSPVLLAFFSLPFLFATLGMGLLASTMAANQIQAAQLAFLIILPGVLLSGFMFPQESMPVPIYWVAQTIPATYYIRILRGIIIRGAGFQELWQQALILSGIGCILLIFAALRFHKTVK